MGNGTDAYREWTEWGGFLSRFQKCGKQKQKEMELHQN